MRRLELLVNEVRDSTDTKDVNSIGIYEIMRYFNDGQRSIQSILHTANPESDLFVNSKTYQISNSSPVELPLDLYTNTSIIGVYASSGGELLFPLTKSDIREMDNIDSYYILGNYLGLPRSSGYREFTLLYEKRIPLLSYRLGRVSNIDLLTNTITVEGASLISNTGFVDRFDYYSIVDSKGIPTANNLLLDSNIGVSFVFEGDLSLVQVNNWIVCGEYGTSHSMLPDECEPFLLAYVQRRILSKISSSDAVSENIFTSEERNELAELFADSSRDIKYPIILG